MFNILNIELSSLCNKKCNFCGRRKIDREYPELKLEYGYMSFGTLCKIDGDLERQQGSIMIQFHNNGEPLLYLKLKEALQLFNGHIRCMDTNGKLLVEKADDIIDNLETITISTFENDPEAEEQYKLVKEFIKIKGDRKPNVIIRVLGNNDIWAKKYWDMGLLTVDRIFHKPMGSFGYTKKTTIPEHGICCDFLNHPAINIKGDVSICVRFDPERKGVIGNINENSFSEIWYGSKRQEWLQEHINGCRDNVPLCKTCDFWGIPRG